MSDIRWSEWIDWEGGECPLEDGVLSQVQLKSGDRPYRNRPAEEWIWAHAMQHDDIAAYRYELTEDPDIWANAPQWADYYAPAQDMYYGRADGGLVFQCGGSDSRITSALWTVDLEGPNFIKRPSAVTDGVTWQATDEEDEAFDAMAKREFFTDSSGYRWRLGSDGMYHGMCAQVKIEDDVRELRDTLNRWLEMRGE